MVNGKLCMSVGRDRIMCRIDPSVHDAAASRQGAKTVIMKGRPYKGYVHVRREVLQTARQLNFWVGLALRFNRKLTGA
jgi:hypothetical protein